MACKKLSLEETQLNESLDALGFQNTELRTSLKTLLFHSSKIQSESLRARDTLLSMLLEQVAKELTVEAGITVSLFTKARSKTTPILLMGSDLETILNASKSLEATYTILFLVSKFLLHEPGK